MHRGRKPDGRGDDRLKMKEGEVWDGREEGNGAEEKREGKLAGRRLGVGPGSKRQWGF